MPKKSWALTILDKSTLCIRFCKKQIRHSAYFYQIFLVLNNTSNYLINNPLYYKAKEKFINRSLCHNSLSFKVFINNINIYKNYSKFLKMIIFLFKNVGYVVYEEKYAEFSMIKHIFELI